MQYHPIHLKIVRSVLLGATLTALSGQALASLNEEFQALKDYVEEQNERGYGKTVSTVFKTLTIFNKTGTNGSPHTYKLRHLVTKGEWSNDTNLAPGYSLMFQMNNTAQVSLNGDGSSDDIKINDTKGYIEYKSGIQSDKNIWANMVTWNGDKQTWLLNSLFDTVAGNETVLLPSINGTDLMITLIDGHNYGTTVSKTFTWIDIKNSTNRTFPLKYKRASGEWSDESKLWPGGTRGYRTDGTLEISLNGDDSGDDLKINDDLGYIEFNLGKATGSIMGIHIKSKKVWMTQAWFHPILNRWFGAGSWSAIDSGDKPNTTLTPKFDLPNKTVIFELQEKKY